MNVAYFGTSGFAAEVLHALAERGAVTPSLVVSQPDRPSGRGRALTAPPVAAAALELALPLTQPQDASAEPPEAEAGVVVAFGQILRAPLLGAYPLVNLHPSALPRWRGAAPVERAIMAGDAETAVAVIEVAPELDAGPILAEQRIAIGEHDDAGAVRRAALELGVPLLERALLERPEPRAQDEQGVTYAHKIEAAERALDWSRPAVELDRKVRALSPHIGARTVLD
ncbi:MAG TPA: methionyl-tRNA formyltransferase, partial [Gaiellales bacterium]|nr:methionyl-tRNA formyltransferase [Gaiellales bacterium]